MVGNIDGTVVVIRTTLILGIEILYHHISQPLAILEIQLSTQHDILERIEEKTGVFLLIPLIRSLAITIIVEEEKLTVVLEEMIGIDAEFPAVEIIVEAHHP